MANFDPCYAVGKRNEGGWAVIKGDRGGKTYMGISYNNWPNWAGWALIDKWIATNGEPKWNKIFTEIEVPGLEPLVKDFYYNNFFMKMQGPDITSQKVAVYFYDWFINSETAATKHIQQIVGIIPPTGFFGSLTLHKVNEMGDALLDKLHESRNEFYKSHVAVVPSDAKFLAEWERRSDETYFNLTNDAASAIA